MWKDSGKGAALVERFRYTRLLCQGGRIPASRLDAVKREGRVPIRNRHLLKVEKWKRVLPFSTLRVRVASLTAGDGVTKWVTSTS